VRTLLLAAALFALAACNRVEDDFVPPDHLDFFPLEIGRGWIYAVDSTLYDPNGLPPVRTSHRLVRERILDTLHDLSGTVRFRIERAERLHDSLPWQVTKIYSASRDAARAYRTEENLRFIKLVFPIRESQTWNPIPFFDAQTEVEVAGETLEMFKGWSARTVAFPIADTLGAFAFDSAAVVRSADSENLIELRFAEERYARGVGLYRRTLRILDTQCIEACQGQSWEEKAERGFLLEQRLLEYW